MWGVEQAQKEGVPAYTEASPAAVGLYKKCGFKELERLDFLEGRYSLTALIWKPQGENHSE